eukprot:g2879.t1
MKLTIALIVRLCLAVVFAFFDNGASQEIYLNGTSVRTRGRVTERLNEVIENAGEGDVVEIDISKITLSQTLQISVANVTLRGYGDREVTISCPSNGGDSALVISANSVLIENVMFSNCTKASAIVINATSSGFPNESMTVEFRNVSFMNNGELNRSVNGSGLRVESSCFENHCPIPEVSITGGKFDRNRGEYGAAIWCQNCSLNITSSVFQSNEVISSGGAIYMNGENSVLQIQSTNFTENIAANSPQFVSSHTSDDLQSFSSFHREGGAIFATSISKLHISDSIFERNLGCYGGGAISYTGPNSSSRNAKDDTFTIENCQFLENQATCIGSESNDVQDIFRDRLLHSGGALSSHNKGQINAQWIIRNSNFIDNVALNGGAIYIVAKQDKLHLITDSHFESNKAEGGGGGGILAVALKLELYGVQFHSNNALYGGGLFIFKETSLYAGPSEDRTTPTEFHSNAAHYGGGIQCNDRYSVELERVIIFNNTAQVLGGGMRCYDSGESVILRGVEFERNRALIGGGITFTASANVSIISYRDKPSIFKHNSAFIGGGFHFSPGHFFLLDIKIKDTEFIGNTAYSVDEIQRRLNSSQTESLNDLEIEFAQKMLKHVLNVDGVLRDRSTVPGGFGGGLSLSIEQIPGFAIVEVVFLNLAFSKNRAEVGGGLVIQVSEAHWNSGKRPQCFPAIFGLTTCQKFVFQNVSITENSASYAGGIFVTKPREIKLTCDHEKQNIAHQTLYDFLLQQINPSNESNSNSVDVCTSISNNTISSGNKVAKGADAGTVATSLHVVNCSGWLKEVASGELLTQPCGDEADCTEGRNITVEVKDAFNQTIVQGISDSEMEVSLISSPVISGVTNYRAVEGIIIINDTHATKINETSILKIKSVRNSSIFVEVKYSTRPCQIGEFTQMEICLKCVPGQYGFIPSLPNCKPCEEHANCSGGAALVPIDGYWHSNPFSPQFHRCFYESACIYHGRAEKLAQYYNNISRLETQWENLENYLKQDGKKQNRKKPEFPDYEQCDEGYQGIVCGSCTDDYGRSANGGCEKCPDHIAVARCLVTVALLWSLIIIALNSGITLTSAKARVQLFLHDLQLRTSEARRPGQLQRAPAINNEVVEMAMERMHAISGNLSEIEDLHARLMLTKHLIATVQLTESLKILVNYLQVTAAALHLPVHWSKGMDGLLSIQAASVGVASESIDVPFECNFDSGGKIHRSISAIWLRILSPAIVLLAMVLIFTSFWIPVHLIAKKRSNVLENLRQKLGHRSWLTCVIVISIVTVHFSYIEIIRELLRTVNCIEIDDTSSKELYENYKTASGDRVWVEDTSLICFKGQHLVTGIVGIIGLFLGLLVIVFIILWLPLNRKHRKKPEFIARYWFIYQGYRKEWYTSCWEAAILIRKTLIAAVLVFSVHLGLTLQATLCVGILLLAHVLQVIFLPFAKEKDHQAIPDYFFCLFQSPKLARLASKFLELNNSVSLNGLESASLISSALIFYSAIVLNDSFTSALGKYLITAVTFAVNVSFLLYILFRLYAGLHGSLDLYLEHMDPPFFMSCDNGPGLLSFVKKLQRVASIQYKSHFGSNRECNRLQSFPELELGSIQLSRCLDVLADDNTGTTSHDLP